MKQIVLIFCILAVQGFTSALYADDDYHEGNADLNAAGAGLWGETSDDGSSAMYFGTHSNAEALYLGIFQTKSKKKHLAIFQGRVAMQAGAGVGTVRTSASNPLFILLLKGSLSAGVQAYYAFPFTPSLEDAEFKLRGDTIDGHGLFGATVYLPISMIAGLRKGSADDKLSIKSPLLLGVTAGARFSSEADSAAGFQAKLRYLSDVASFESRFLIAPGSRNEKRFVIDVGVKDVITEGDQLGANFEWTRHDDAITGDTTVEPADSFEGGLYYGGNL